MKGKLAAQWIVPLCFASLASSAPLPPPTVTERGPHHRVWERAITNTLPDGRIVTNKSSYVELATGMHFFRDGQWRESRDVIELVPNGAVAQDGPCPVAFASNLRTPGAIDLVSDGLRFRANPLGIAYVDAANGRSVMLAQLQDCVGELISPNQILYRNAFDGLNADVLYIYRKDGLEQFVILRENPPPPADYQMNEATVRLEAWTEFLDPPTPVKQESILRQETDPAARQAMVDPDFRDHTLSFGNLRMGPGGAFPMANDVPGELDTPAAPVGKRWIHIPDTGRTFLIEQVEYPAIKPQLELLPQVAAIRKPDANAPQMARRFPERPNAAATTRPMQMAQAKPAGSGFAIDWSLLTSWTNMVFRGDTTYFVSSSVTLGGTSVVEGGTCIKFTNSTSPSTSRLQFNGPIDCRTDQYRPAFLTAMDDDTVGETIAGSTGSPGTNRYAGRAMEFNSAGTTYDLHNLRIRHSHRATYITPANTTLILSYSQIGFSDIGVYNNATAGTATLRNVLIHDVLTAFNQVNNTVGKCEHLTLHRVPSFRSSSTGSTSFLTNSLLISVTNNVVFSGGSDVVTNHSDTGIFETVGAGAHYLPANSPYIGIGSNSISPSLRADLRQRTTEPPEILANDIVLTTTLAPRAKRDTNSLPTLGYHYDPLDYVASQIALTNAVLTLTPGTVLGTYGATNQAGIWVLDRAKLFSEGTAMSPVTVVRYNLAQEQANTNWSSPTFGLSIATPLSFTTNLAQVEVRFGFTRWSMPAAGQFHFYAASSNLIMGITNCEFYGGRLRFGRPNVTLANCLFERTDTLLISEPYPFGVSVYNGTFFGGRAIFENNQGGTWTVTDNVFDQVALFVDGTVNADYNAYTTNLTLLNPGATHDVLLAASNLTYEVWPLGRFYLPTNSPLTNVGSRLASEAGLFHFTTATNQVKETNSQVDIGFHYVALGTNGLPADLDGDGVADYEEDVTGDGNHTEGERVWYVYDTDRDYDGLWDTNDPNPDVADPRRLGYWRFQTTNFLGELGETPLDPHNLSNVVLTNSWSTNALSVIDTFFSGIRYRETDYNLMTNGGSKATANFNCRNGTIRLWFRPHWSSTNVPGGTGPQNGARLVEVGANSAGAWLGQWSLAFGSDGNGNSIRFTSQSNGISAHYLSAPISWTNGLWHQVALTHSPTNVSLYIDGRLSDVLDLDYRPTDEVHLRINNAPGGIFNYPSESVRRTSGFRIGQSPGGHDQAKGDFDELETFNYPLSAAEIARDFPNARGLVADPTLDTDYDGRSDHLEREVDGRGTNNSASVVSNRLGYWRFNAAANNLIGEQGQVPLLASNISVASGWSSNALVISSASTSSLVYRDVETNGWPNVNCQNGTVSFWFKPAWVSAGFGGGGPPSLEQPFIYVGGTNEKTSGWRLYYTDTTAKLRFAFGETEYLNAGASLTTKWYHVALTFTPSYAALYVNGLVVGTNGLGATNFPVLNDRTNGLVIGNKTGGGTPINGDFDELETFNYPLTAAEIQRKFAMVHSVDNDLNGVPDLVEDPVLSAPVPFGGIPFAITGCIEAEQFDRGGQGVAYNSLGGNMVTNDYRPSMMEIVTNTTDFAAGFIVDKLRAGEWLNYSLDVRVGQNYAVEARVAGIGTGGVFHVEFTNAATGAFTNTGPLVLLSTNWTNLARTLLPLPAGTNVMRVVMDTNSTSNAVCQLSYISIYPSWVEGVSNIVQTHELGTGSFVPWSTNSDWGSAKTNGFTLQKAVNDLSNGPGQGGLVVIPSGTYYVAQEFVDENADAEDNSAAVVVRNSVEIRGAGKTNTTLITHNRATTVFYIGHDRTNSVAVTNFTLRDLTLEGRPHLVATNAGANGFITFFETGALDTRGVAIGNLVVFGGMQTPTTNPSVNLLFTNCLFRNPTADGLWSEVSCISNVAIRNCDFIFRDGTNGAFPFPRSITNTNIPNTVLDRADLSGVGFFVRSCETFAQNLLMLDCAFNGNPALTNLSPNNTNFDAGDGIFWTQAGVNCFVGRCAITNYGLEGVQFGDGPAAAVANDFRTFVSLSSTAGLLANGSTFTITQSSNDNTFYFVGNRIVGGRFGYAEHEPPPGAGTTVHSRPNFSGNYLELTPPYDVQTPNEDNTGAGFVGGKIEHANIAGNKLVAGGHGARWDTKAISGLVLKNDFAAASFRALAYTGTNAITGPAFRFIILRNSLGQGSQFHLKGPVTDPGIFFSSENTFKDGTITVNPFIDPSSAPVHTRHKP